MVQCCDHEPPTFARPVLWAALAINAAMFLTEMVAGAIAGSVSLHADAVDFLGDSFNYAISLAVIGLALTWRARAALPKRGNDGVARCLGFGRGSVACHSRARS
jgi:Co/Zn/Cd efflux system component